MQKTERGARIIADLQSWGIDAASVAEVRDAFREGRHQEAMALARDLGWNRASKRGRAPGSGRATQRGSARVGVMGAIAAVGVGCVAAYALTRKSGA